MKHLYNFNPKISTLCSHLSCLDSCREARREILNRFAPLAMDAEDTISSIWGDSSTPSSPRASASPMECPPSPSKSQSPSKSRHPRPAEKPQGPPPSPSPPYPFTPEVHVTEWVKPTKNIKGVAGQPKVWNIRGFGSNFEELKLLNRLQAAVVALQECRLGEGQLPPRGYKK
ncbi:hypothetical protein PoB_001501100 [Plakobranchus ocellatus]|uniref:Uncharacterized protein n=1 Tax=Plakobranchus ocellatus TaxID=259542 RepID=A0AAV3YMN6_9GAST|nr:hypothetical protein PoB_001501100 [Plakobranchus ocellatus]